MYVITDETNRYGPAKSPEWVDVSRDEIWTFLGSAFDFIGFPAKTVTLVYLHDLREHMSRNIGF